MTLWATVFDNSSSKPHVFFTPWLSKIPAMVDPVHEVGPCSLAPKTVLLRTKKETAEQLKDRCEIWLRAARQEEHGEIFVEFAEKASKSGVAKESSVFFHHAGVKAYEKGDKEAARDYFNKSLDLSTNNAESWNTGVVQIYENTGDAEVCLDLLDRGIDFFEDSKELVFHAITIARILNDDEKIKAYMAMLSVDNLYAYFQEQIEGISALNKSNASLAIKFCQSLLRQLTLAPPLFHTKKPDICYRVYTQYYLRLQKIPGQADEIRQVLETALQVLPKEYSGKVLLNKGIFESKQRNYKAAIAAFAEALEGASPSFQFTINEHWAYSAIKNGAFQDAINCYEKLFHLSTCHSKQVLFLKKSRDLQVECRMFQEAEKTKQRIDQLYKSAEKNEKAPSQVRWQKKSPNAAQSV